MTLSTKTEQTFTYTATGGESSLAIPLSPSWPDTTYVVLSSCQEVNSVVGIAVDISSKSTTRFTAVTTAPLTAGDQIQFRMFDPVGFTQIVIGSASFQQNMDVTPGTAKLAEGQWNISNGLAELHACLPLPLGSMLKNVTFYYKRDSGGSAAVGMAVCKKNGSLTLTTIASYSDTTGTGSTSHSLSGLTEVVGASPDTQYFVKFSSDNGLNHPQFVRVDYQLMVKS